jgi:hypothetical protein
MSPRETAVIGPPELDEDPELVDPLEELLLELDEVVLLEELPLELVLLDELVLPELAVDEEEEPLEVELPDEEDDFPLELDTWDVLDPPAPPVPTDLVDPEQAASQATLPSNVPRTRGEERN